MMCADAVLDYEGRVCGYLDTVSSLKCLASLYPTNFLLTPPLTLHYLSGDKDH
jgi:hypothetical protein